MTARTPHGKAADELVANGPVSRDEFIRHVAAFVPIGQAVATTKILRTSSRKYCGIASGIDGLEVASGFENRSIDPTYRGSKAVASNVLLNRLNYGTYVINDDGLIQHRDWRP